MTTLDARIAELDAKVIRMNRMKAELDKMDTSSNSMKEFPAYDNRSNVMNSLSVILADASQYNVSFSTISEEDNTVRCNISLSYSCVSRRMAQEIFQNIDDDPFPCLIKNCNIIGGKGTCSVSMELTYFEYK